MSLDRLRKIYLRCEPFLDARMVRGFRCFGHRSPYWIQVDIGHAAQDGEIRVDSQKGKEIYNRLMSVVEPVFGNIGTTNRLNRFSLRGKKKVHDDLGQAPSKKNA